MLNVKINANGLVLNFIERYKVWKDYQNFYSNITCEYKIENSEQGIPCYHYTNIKSINQSNSKLIAIDCLTEGIHSKYFFDQYDTSKHYLIFSNGEEYYKVMAEYLIKSIASDRTASVRGGGKFRKHIKSAISRHITKFGKKTMKPTHIPYIIIKSFKEQYINEELSKLTLAIYIANYGNIKMECNGCVSGSLHKKIQKMVKVLSSLKYPNIPISKDDNPYYLDFVKDQLIYLITVDNNRIAEQLYQIIEGEFEDDTYYLDPSVLEIIDMYIKFITHKKSRKIKYTRSAVKTPRAKSRIPVSHTPSPSSSSELGEVRELIYAGGGSSKLRKTRRKRRN